MAHGRSMLALFVALGFGFGTIPATSQTSSRFSTVKKEYDRALRGRELGKRLVAIEAMKELGEGAVVPVLFGSLVKGMRTRVKLEKSIAKRRKALNDEYAKRVTKPRMDSDDRRKAKELLQRLQADDRRKLTDEETRLRNDGKTADALREAMTAVLAELTDRAREKAGRYMVGELKRQKKGEQRVEVIRAMAHCQDPQVEAALIESCHTSPIPSVRVSCLDALARFKPEKAEATALVLIDDDYWQVRAAALGLLRTLGGKACIPGLIERLEHEKGRILSDLEKTLTHLTSADFHDNVHLWRRWWKEHGSSYAGRGEMGGSSSYEPTTEVAASRQGSRPQDGSGFYGIRTRSTHIIYILDVSGSMNRGKGGGRGRGGPRGGGQGGGRRRGAGGEPPQAKKGERKIDQAVAELCRSINSLPSDGSFNIVFYDSKVAVWKKSMQAAGADNKKAATAWARKVAANGNTNIFDAVERAFGIAGRGAFDKNYRVAAETIFLLSDGDANRGRIVQPQAMLREIAKMNRLSKIEINCVGLGRSRGNRFLEQLAAQNGGQYVRVD